LGPPLTVTDIVCPGAMLPLAGLAVAPLPSEESIDQVSVCPPELPRLTVADDPHAPPRLTLVGFTVSCGGGGGGATQEVETVTVLVPPPLPPCQAMPNEALAFVPDTPTPSDAPALSVPLEGASEKPEPPGCDQVSGPFPVLERVMPTPLNESPQ
jgi:hypothetical protein